MKMLKYIVVFFLISILSYSCSNQTKTDSGITEFDYNSFKTVHKLKGHVYDLDTTVLAPKRLHIYGSVLAVLSPKEDKVLHLFNLESGKELACGLEIGQGPKDFLAPEFVDTSDSSEIVLSDMAMSTVVKYHVEEFLHHENPEFDSRTSLSNDIFGRIGMLRNRYIAPAFCEKFLLHSFDTKGNIVDSIGTYPDTEFDVTAMEKMTMFGFQLATNNVDRIAVCYSWTDMIDIYDDEGNLLKRMHGPDHFMSRYKERRMGKAVGAMSIKGQSWDAYSVPVSVGDEFWILYSGAKDLESNFSDYRKRILVFDKDGTPLRILELDRGIIMFDVDECNRNIYAICSKPEYHIIKYAY